MAIVFALFVPSLVLFAKNGFIWHVSFFRFYWTFYKHSIVVFLCVCQKYLKGCVHSSHIYSSELLCILIDSTKTPVRRARNKSLSSGSGSCAKNQRPFFCYGFILSSVLKTRSTAQLPLWHEQQILPCLEESGWESSAQDIFKPFLLKSTWWDGRVVVRQSRWNWWHRYCWGKNLILICARLTSTNNTLHCWKGEVILSVSADVFITCLNGLEYSRDTSVQSSLF